MMQTLLDNLVATLERFGKRIQDAFLVLWEALLARIEEFAAVARNFALRIKSFIAQLFHTLSHLMIVLAKLSLFYLPGLLALLLDWRGFAIFWLVLVTAMGLLYGKGRTGESAWRSRRA